MEPSNTTEASVGYLVYEVARAFRRRFEDEARRHDLTLPQWRALAELARKGGVSQVVLAGAIDADPMTVSGILDRLEKRGLVRREPDPSDSRAKIVRLTDEGLALYDTAKAVGVELYQSAVLGMSPAELDAVANGLTRIRNNLNGPRADQKEDA
ncbi:MarR family winged helix-turn-helix transcriptional regulator [Devosia ginsengisoli]|uniref:MarR family transcriptional regulator n=1 Tax=Devosia ginsengisoli TaxID=400770 RepID=A0A5B8LU66_9HYPH|nr:MarR family transcriptional regulator [Devosia ginsengisoli]QDZ11837.1 MarR family transcriptional regulator [Devosia ginsengisoli]